MTRGGSGNLTDFFAEINRLIGSDNRAITGYHLSTFGSRAIAVHGYHRIREHVISCGRGQHPVAFTIQLHCIDIPYFNQSNLIEYTFANLPTEHLRGLNLIARGEPQLSVDAWRSTFGKLPALNYVRIGEGSTTMEFFEALEDEEAFPSLIAIAGVITPSVSRDFETRSFPSILRSRLENGKKMQQLLLHGVPEDRRGDFGSVQDLVGRLELVENLPQYFL